MIHQPVMPEQVLTYLQPQPKQIYVDLTLGAGGHSELILEKMAGQGLVIGIDRDPEILQYAKERLQRFIGTFQAHQSKFSQFAQVLNKLNIAQVNGFLLDAGVSSWQLDQGRRGFSFQTEGPLDMRMDPEQNQTAQDVVNHYSEEELARIFREYGEESRAQRIARAIVKARKLRSIKSTLQLAQIISDEFGFKRGRIHPATKVFQALRIEVNQELTELQSAISKAIEYLRPRGRLVVISFHSLEDRIVKQTFRKYQKQGCGQILTPKPILPSRQEIAHNPRSRSAKLRCLEREGAE